LNTIRPRAEKSEARQRAALRVFVLAGNKPDPPINRTADAKKAWDWQKKSRPEVAS
jgi:hypothetical protein